MTLNLKNISVYVNMVGSRNTQEILRAFLSKCKEYPLLTTKPCDIDENGPGYALYFAFYRFLIFTAVALYPMLLIPYFMHGANYDSDLDEEQKANRRGSYSHIDTSQHWVAGKTKIEDGGFDYYEFSHQVYISIHSYGDCHYRCEWFDFRRRFSVSSCHSINSTLHFLSWLKNPTGFGHRLVIFS